jgi:hypothetical protein
MNFASGLCSLWDLFLSLTNPVRGFSVTVNNINRNHLCPKHISLGDKYGLHKWQVCIKLVASMASVYGMYR